MLLTALKQEDIKAFFNLAYDYLKASEQEINNLNVFPVPDGDTGTNMLLTLSSVVAALSSNTLKTMQDVASSATKAVLLSARGNSGVILSQIIKGFFAPVKEHQLEEIGPKELIECLESAKKTAYKAVKKPVEGTMLTVIKYAAEGALKLKKKKNLQLSEVAEEARRNAAIALQKTPEMLPVLKEAGVVDAGGLGLLKIFDALFSVCTGKAPEVYETQAFAEIKTTFDKIPSEEITYSFCTEFLIQSNQIDIESAHDFLNNYGDSVLVVKDEDIVKIHIHTDSPLDLLNYFKNYGEFVDIKINNMKMQTQEANKARKENLQKTQQKPLAIVAVAQGKGIIEVFKSLGTDVVIEGGQTMNPSSEQILKAIENAPSDTVIVLPNNKNVILACEQAASLTDKKVRIIPTTSIQQGLQAMLAFNPALDEEKNVQKMESAIKDVVSVSLTKAVKDSNLNGLQIKKGNYLGLIDGKIAYSGEDLAFVLVKTMQEAGIQEASFVTIFVGKELDQNDSEFIASIMEKNFPEVEFEIKYGGQDHYPILAAIER